MSQKKLFLPLILIALSGCGGEKIVETKEEITQIANPASVYCEEHDGKLVIEKDTFGDIGWCNFKDKSFCEEWAYFRGECQPGKNF